MAESFRCRIVKWDEIAKWSAATAEKVKEGGYRPEVVIGLTRGGWVPARLMCDHLMTKSLYAVKTEHWGVTATPTGAAVLAQGLNMNLAGKRVLVVDDITDTGQSLALALEHIRGLGPSAVKSATLLHITHSKVEPDFYTVRVPKEEWTWFIFPWNFHEDLRTLMPKTLDSPLDAVGVRAALKRQFRITVTSATVREKLVELVGAGVLTRAGKRWKRAA